MYKVTLPKAVSPVGVLVEYGKVTVAHPSVKAKIGMSVQELKRLVKKKKGHIEMIRPIKRSK